jgi:hypothetical protein
MTDIVTEFLITVPNGGQKHVINYCNYVKLVPFLIRLVTFVFRRKKPHDFMIETQAVSGTDIH